MHIRNVGAAGVMLKQVIAEMEHAKEHLDRGLLFRSQSPTADGSAILTDVAAASASAKLMRQRCSAALAAHVHDKSRAACCAPNPSQAGHACDQGKGGVARQALLEEVSSGLEFRSTLGRDRPCWRR